MTYVTPTSGDLGTALGDTTVNTDRADYFIYAAEVLAKSIVNPLPDGADVVVLRMAGRAYVTVTQAKYAQAAASGVPFGAMPGGSGDLSLAPKDIADLRRMAGGGGAFSIDMLPAGYVAPAVGFGCYSGDFDVIP